MQKVWRGCAAVLGRVIFIGFGIQIVLGIFWMCSAFADLHGFREGIVCVAQILLAGCAAYFFLRSAGIEKKYFRLFGSLAIVTFPMVMQCHMTVGPHSVLSSALLLLIGWLLRLGKKKWKVLWQSAVAIVLGVAIAGFVIFGLRKESPETCWASRIAWTTIYQTYDNWSKGCKRRISYMTMAESSYEASGIRSVMAPRLTTKVGEEKTSTLLKKISKKAWKYNASQIRKEIAWDVAGYMVPPVVVPLQLRGRAYDSYTGENYRQMLQPAPRLGKIYMDYGCWWFGAGLAMAALLLLLKRRLAGLSKWIVSFLPGIVMAVSYAMSGAGQMDYKNVVYLLCVWLAAIFAAAEKEIDGEC